METILRTKELTKRYHKVCAVDHITLSIQKGDIFGFVGANGAGKTTFMRMRPDTPYGGGAGIVRRLLPEGASEHAPADGGFD